MFIDYTVIRRFKVGQQDQLGGSTNDHHAAPLQYKPFGWLFVIPWSLEIFKNLSCVPLVFMERYHDFPDAYINLTPLIYKVILITLPSVYLQSIEWCFCNLKRTTPFQNWWKHCFEEWKAHSPLCFWLRSRINKFAFVTFGQFLLFGAWLLALTDPD